MGTPAVRRVVILVMDSVGAGEAPDAARYGDSGANTLGNIARSVGGLRLPNLQQLGLGNLTDIAGVPPTTRATGAFGKLREASAGKDTTTGHWELAGLHLADPFPVFADGFPPEILDPFMARTGRGVLGNVPASGTTILDELGEEHMRTGKLIVYTSGDSVFQIAAHEDVVPIEELYRISKIAREILDPYKVGRVIARPFVGTGKGDFQRTYNRRDFSILPTEQTVLEHMAARGIPVVGVGKIGDIYAGRGISEDIHTEGNQDGLEKSVEALARVDRGLVFCNLVDFDMLYGHRNDPPGYARCLAELDAFLPRVHAALREGDLVMLTADHGNDPTTPGTDHTREYVPLLCFGPACAPHRDLGIRSTFADVGATLAQIFETGPLARGKSFLSEILPAAAS